VLNHFIKLYNLNLVISASFGELMPSDKHNLRTAGARDLISSLINVASSRDVPFDQLQLLQCLHKGATFVPL